MIRVESKLEVLDEKTASNGRTQNQIIAKIQQEIIEFREEVS
jgi:hypothetical protein